MKLPAYEPRRCRIEIVPMIDTIFFLLVYFLIASLTMTRWNAHKLALPESTTAAVRTPSQVIVTLENFNHCYIDRTAVDEAALTPALKKRLDGDPKLTVVINCDKDAPVAAFNRLYDLIKQANPVNVMIATTPVRPDTMANGRQN
jgi:biopolymer transport protein ExbD